MDINYFLLLQKKYKEIQENIDQIIENFNEINELSNEFILPLDKSLHNIFDTKIHQSIFIEKRKQITEYKELCKQYIQNLCSHEFVEDEIDISPDKSRSIVYCKLCEHCPSALSRMAYIYSQRA
jgi:hypothetical protein